MLEPSPWPSPGGRGDSITLAKLRTFSLVGIEALPVEVEVDVSPSGLPKHVLVGLPEAAVKESTHRVERAMVNSGFKKSDALARLFSTENGQAE